MERHSCASFRNENKRKQHHPRLADHNRAPSVRPAAQRFAGIDPRPPRKDERRRAIALRPGVQVHGFAASEFGETTSSGIYRSTADGAGRMEEKAPETVDVGNDDM